MTEQEITTHNAWKIIWLEQEKEELRREYFDKIAAINLEIFQLQARTSNAEIISQLKNGVSNATTLNTNTQ